MACMWILSVLQVYGHHQAKSCITENSGWENKGSVLTIMSNLVMICQHAISRQTRGTTQQGGLAHSTGIPQIKVTQVYKTHYVLANCNDSNLIFSPNILAHDHAPLCQVWLQKTVPSLVTKDWAVQKSSSRQKIQHERSNRLVNTDMSNNNLGMPWPVTFTLVNRNLGPQLFCTTVCLIIHQHASRHPE